MKKLFSYLLLLCLILSVSACDNTATQDPAEEVDTEPVYKDMNGAAYYIATGWVNQFFPERVSTEWGERVRKRYDELEEKFNCTISLLDITGLNHGTFLTTNIAADSEIPEIFDIHARDAYNYYKADMLLPFEDLTTIDLSETKWGPEKFRQYGSFGGKSYGVFTYDWETMPELAGVLLFNLEIMKEHGITENPHEMDEQGRWTWDEFTELIKICTFPEDEIIGFGNRETNDMLIKAAIFSNNGEILKKTDTGYTFGLTSPEVYEAMEWISSLNTQKLIKNISAENFVAKKSTFLFCESWVGTHTDDWMAGKYPAANMKDYSFINMPIGPNGTKGEASAFVHTGRRLWWMPTAGENDKDDWGMVMDAMFEPLEDSDHEAWKTMSKQFMFLYPEGYDNFVNCADNAKYDFSVQLEAVNSK
ncbi:MAG: transporter substrate-binding protein, partial [Clostridia bacterium]|nr:transporter substrate-binding protein [Clostridia bacterium]